MHLRILLIDFLPTAVQRPVMLDSLARVKVLGLSLSALLTLSHDAPLHRSLQSDLRRFLLVAPECIDFLPLILNDVVLLTGHDLRSISGLALFAPESSL